MINKGETKTTEAWKKKSRKKTEKRVPCRTTVKQINCRDMSECVCSKRGKHCRETGCTFSISAHHTARGKDASTGGGIKTGSSPRIDLFSTVCLMSWEREKSGISEDGHEKRGEGPTETEKQKMHVWTEKKVGGDWKERRGLFFFSFLVIEPSFIYLLPPFILASCSRWRLKQKELVKTCFCGPRIKASNHASKGAEFIFLVFLSSNSVYRPSIPNPNPHISKVLGLLISGGRKTPLSFTDWWVKKKSAGRHLIAAVWG